MKDTRSFLELSAEEQQQLVEWINVAFFPTRDGGMSLSSIAEECFFLTDKPSTLWPGSEYQEIWEPSQQAVRQAMKQVGWIKQREVKQGRGEPVTFYAVKLFYYVLPTDMQPVGTMLRDFFDWSFAPSCRERQLEESKKSIYSWNAM